MNAAGRTSVVPAAHRLVVGDDDGQQVLRVQNAGDVVERVVDTRESARARSCARGRAPRDHGVVAVDADDVHARHHDLVHRRVAEREHAVQNRLLRVGDVRLGGDDLAELLGRRFAVFFDRATVG